MLAVALLALLVSLPARAAEVTRAVTTLNEDQLFDFSVTASWLHEIRSAYIKRESQSPPASDIELIKDLKYKQTRDILNLRMDFGVLWSIGLHVSLPIVLTDSSTLAFDQSGSDCIYPGDMSGARPTCVNQANSTILRDGILPSDTANGTWGLGNRYKGADTEVFRSPKRNGLPFLNVGVTWAVFDQQHDDTKPTWTLNFDANLDLFKDMRFDPSSPAANTAVGLGYHQLVASTWVSKRFRHFDPYFGAWYMFPIRTNGSPFQKYPGNGYQMDTQTAVQPQQQAGVTIGVEQIAWEDVPAKQRVTIEFQFHAQEFFYGRGHSELWQPLSGSSACAASGVAPACRPGIDGDLNGNSALDPYPGVTEIDSYASFGGQVGLNVQVGKFVRFRGLGGFATDMPHFITGASAGVDKDGNHQVDTAPSSVEANPLYRETIDLPGRRFKVEGTQIWTIFLEGSLMF